MVRRPKFGDQMKGMFRSARNGTAMNLFATYREVAAARDERIANEQNQLAQATASSQEAFSIAKRYLNAFIKKGDELDQIKHLIVTSGVFFVLQGAIDTSVLSKTQEQQLQTYALELVESRRDYAGERITRDHMRNKSQQLDEATRAEGDRTRWSGKQP